MENSWNIENVRSLFAAVKLATETGRSLSSVFKEFAAKTGFGAGSVRNYYYSQARLFKMMPELARQMGIAEPCSKAKQFVTFSPDEAKSLVVRALVGKARGQSIRAVFSDMACGNKSLALRYQNKYRSMLVHHKTLVMDIMNNLKSNNIAYFDPYLKVSA